MGNSTKKITRSQISESIRKLGISSGDILYVRADLGKIGRLEGNATDVFIGGILDVLGSEGTLMVPAFTKMSKIWDKEIVLFDENSIPITGALSKRFLKMDDVKRSKHPSHSFAAFGKQADALLEGHTKDSACFEPMRNLCQMRGKMALIGCMQESPGFSTVHLAQHDLGLSQRHYLKFFYICKIREGDKLVNFRPKESPGCSQGFFKFYKEYEKNNNYIEGMVGHARSLCVSALKAFELEKDILKDNPRFTLCGDPTCVSCYITRGYNKRNIMFALTGHIKKMLGYKIGRE